MDHNDQHIVGIILCTHNNTKNIERAVNSLLTSSRKPNRIIVGDNDSKDHTYDALCRMIGAEQITIGEECGFPSTFRADIDGVDILIFKNKHTNRSRVLNYCFSKLDLTTTVIGFLNPNDWYGPDKIYRSLQILDQHSEVACVVSDYNEKHHNKLIRRFSQSFMADKLIEKSIYDRNFIVRVNGLKILGSGFDNELVDMEYYDFLLRLSEIGLIYHLPEALHNRTTKEKTSVDIKNKIKHKALLRRSKNVKIKK